ncbi:hypothetical protein ACGFZR_09340 [Streptomyces sp. NPDC048241]|uniref:hypothetical protein n=1 Tax=Streptomyces sp. NPDC048241 TaxID=3365521 RepID=UPI00371E83B7
MLPDYDGSRKSSHRVWSLPRSKHPLYTYGKHDKVAEAAVDELIDRIGFEDAAVQRRVRPQYLAARQSGAQGTAALDLTGPCGT